RLALRERRLAQVEAFGIEQIEGMKDEPLGASLAQRRLQRGEVRRARFVLHHQLAVDQRLAQRQLFEGRADRLAELVGPIETAPGEQSYLAAVDARLQAIAVELDLVHPAAALRRLALQGGEARLDEIRQRCLARALDGLGVE